MKGGCMQSSARRFADAWIVAKVAIAISPERQEKTA
jgi:hypothetical protein